MKGRKDERKKEKRKDRWKEVRVDGKMEGKEDRKESGPDWTPRWASSSPRAACLTPLIYIVIMYQWHQLLLSHPQAGVAG